MQMNLFFKITISFIIVKMDKNFIIHPKINFINIVLNFQDFMAYILTNFQNILDIIEILEEFLN